MRSLLRPFATALLGIAVATCSDTPIATVKSGATPAGLGRAVLSVQPSFSKSAQFAAEHAADFGIGFDSVHIVIRGLPDTTRIVLDTTVFFRPDSPDLKLDLSVPVRSDGERFDAGLGYTLGGTIQFYGHGTVQSHAPNAPAPPDPKITIDYHGPGARVARLSVSPPTSTLSGTQAATLTVAAFDSTGASMTLPPLLWSSSNASIATVSAAGLVQAQNRRGSATITAQSPTGISASASVSVVLPPASIALVSGAGQTGKAGSTLANPAVVQVSAADGVGVAGASVVFAAPAGGSVTPTTATTDANGRASTTLRLGNAAGLQGFAATSNGFSVAISETATAADPSAIAIVSGNNQTDSVRKTLAPLSVRVTDSFGNPVSGASVAWARTAGSGSLGSAASTTNTDGIATNTYTLGTTAGAEAVTASITGASVSFSFTTGAGGPAAIVAISGDAQTGRIAQALAAPFVVRVNDAGGNPVSNATVTWTATNGTIAATSTTDATGQTSATLTGGTTLGAAGATAKIANGQTVSFTATLQPGFVSQMAFSTPPTNGTPNVTLSPVRVALRDAGGNATAAVNPVTIALGNNSNGAVLTGTLTRNAVNGVATFDDLKLDKSGSGYTLVATSGSLPSVTSAAFNTAVGGAATLTIMGGDNQSATVNTAVSVAPSVKATDAANNPVPGVVVTFAAASGSVAPANGQVTTNALGIATLTSWTLGTTAGAQTLTASASGAANVTFHATAGAGAAAKLGITGIATAAVSGVALSPQPTLQVQDQFGNAVPAGTMTIVASSTPSSGVTISNGSVAANATTGVVTFTNLSVLTTSSSITLTFAVQGTSTIQSVTSSSIAIAAATPTQLVLIPATPTTYTKTAGVALSPSPSVKALDANGNAVPNAGVLFTVKQGATVVGTTTLNTDASGVIDAANVSTPDVAGTYTVTASLVATPSATQTVTVTVVAGGSANLAINGGNNQSATVNTAVSTAPSAKVTDASGNPVAGVVVTFTPASGSGSTSPANGQATTDATGVATLTSWTLGTVTGAQSLTASTAGASNVTFSATATAGSAANLAINGGNNQSATVNTAVSTAPSAKVTDAFGNVVAGVVVTFSGSGSTSPANGQVTTNASGVATLTSWTLGTASGAQSLTVSASGTSNVTINATATAGSVANLAVNGGNNQSATVSTAVSTAPSAKVTDAFGNAVAGVVVTFTPASGSGTTSPANGQATTNASGIATLTSWTLGSTAGAQSLTASASGASNVTFSATATAGTAANLAINGGNNQSATVNTAVSTAPSAKVTDASGNPVAGVVVTFTPASGSGSTSPANGQATTDAAGVATLTSWTLGTASGAQSLTASTAGASNVTFSATATAGSAANLAINGGNNQSATVNTAVGTAPSAKVTDAFGNAVASVVVTFTPASGSGTTSPANGQVTTNASGVATLTSWTLGTASGAQSLTVSASGTSNVTIDATANAGAAATVAINAGNGQSAAVNTAVTTAPAVKVTDAFGNVVAGVVVTFIPASGSGTTSPANGQRTTNASGIATLTSWTLGTTTGAQSLTASASGATSATFSATATAGSADHLVTSGAAALVNDAGSGVTTSPSSPTVTVVDAFGNTVTTGATVNWTTSTCATGFSLGSSSSTSNGSGDATVSVTVPNNTAGSCKVTGTLSSSSKTFYVIMKPSGANAWTNGAADGVYGTNGNWSGGTPTSSSAVYVPAAVSAAPQLSANGAAGSIALESNASNSVALNNHTLAVSGNVDASGSGITGGTLAIDASSAATIKGTLPAVTVGNATSCGSSSYSLNGSTTTTGAVTVNCSLSVGANSMIVGGNFSTATANGLLVMTNASGLVDVGGSSTFAGASETGSLTAGTFEARGAFTQTNNGSTHDTYSPSGTHKTSLWGSGAQNVSFEDPVNSFFYNAEVRNGGITATFTSPVLVKNDFAVIRAGASGNPEAKFSDTLKVVGNLTVGNGASLTFTSGATRRRVVVDGTVTDSASADLGGVDTLVVTGSTFPVYLNTTAGKAPRLTQSTGTVSMTANRTVGGGLEVGSNLTLAGKTLTVLDSVNVTGNLKFLSASSGGTLKVGRNFKIAGTGTVTAQAGTLELSSDFTQGGTVSTAFQPSSGFLTKFTGTSAQSISFSNPGTGATKSYFRDLTITNSNASGVTFSTDGSVLGALLVSGGVLKTGSGRAITTMSTVTSTSGSELSGIAELIDSASTFPSFAGNSTPAKTTVAYRLGFMTLGGDAFLTGALSVKGNLSVGGHLLTTQDLTVESTGILSVASNFDTVVVKGNAEFKGDQSNNPFTSGAFDFKGNFTASSASSFYTGTGTNNTVRFTGTSAQTVDISGTDNYFANVAIGEQYNANGYTISNSSVTLASGAIVKGVLDLHTSSTLTIPSNKTLTISTLDPALNFHDGSIMVVNGEVLPVRPNCYYNSGGTHGSPQINGTGIFDGLTVSQGAANGISTSIRNSCTDAFNTLP